MSLMVAWHVLGWQVVFKGRSRALVLTRARTFFRLPNGPGLATPRCVYKDNKAAGAFGGEFAAQSSVGQLSDFFPFAHS